MKVCSCCERIYVSEKDFLRQTSRWRMAEDGNLYFNCSCNSTLMIRKDKHPWYRPDRFMSTRAASVFNRFSNQMHFPLLSKAALEAGRMVSDDKANVNEIADNLKLDPVLSLWILELSNAARPKSSAPIRNLVQAINVLGRLRIQELLTVTAICRFTMKTKHYKAFDYFQSAFVTGALAKEMAILSGHDEIADLAFVSGALCNVGKMLGAISFPKETDAAFLETTQLSSPLTWSEAEEKLGLVSHTILGEIACALWGASPEVIECVQKHHAPLAKLVIIEGAPDADERAFQATLLSCVVFANEMGKHVTGESHLSSQKVLDSCLSSFNMSKTEFEAKVARFQTVLLPEIRKAIERVGFSPSGEIQSL